MQISDFNLNVNNLSVDTLPLFIQLTADTESAYKEIDLLYESDSSRFQGFANTSPYANHLLFTASNIDREIYAAKYSGILFAAIEAGPDSTLFNKAISIMSKRWHELYHYISNCETIELSEVIQPTYYSKFLQNKQQHNLLAGATNQYLLSFLKLYPLIDLPLHASLKFALFIACILAKKVTASDPSILSLLQIYSTKIDNTNEMQSFKKRLNKPTVKKAAHNLKNIIYQRVHDTYLEQWQGNRQLEGFAHCNAYLSLTEGVPLLSSAILMQARERDVELLCRLYIVKMAAKFMYSHSLPPAGKEAELDCAEFVMLGLNLLQLAREYKKTRKYYFAQNAAHLLNKVNNLNKHLSDYELENRRLSMDLAAKNKLLATKEAEINELVLKQKLLSSLATKKEQLKTTIFPFKKKKNKIPQRQAVPSKNVTTMLTSLPATEDALKALAKVHALVIGGNENWQLKLKAKLPHFTYLAGDITKFDAALILNADIIFANVSNKFNHDCFDKVIKLIRQYGKYIVFMSKTNISLTVLQMAKAVTNSAYIAKQEHEYYTEYNKSSYTSDLR